MEDLGKNWMGWMHGGGTWVEWDEWNRKIGRGPESFWERLGDDIGEGGNSGGG